MHRLKLALGMLAFAAVIVFVVAFSSPYAPVVAPVADIEAIWAIEDARTQSDAPLVTKLENHGVPLAYDAQENTFYCTLGLDHGESWPQIHLTAPGAQGVELVFVDDYGYDWCADAISEGYPYQVMAYTDTQFSYFDVVFTGLMQVCLQTSGAIGMEDTPVHVSLQSADASLESFARTHYRGGVTLTFEKHPYKLEFTRTASGEDKVFCAVPQMGQMDQFILIPMWYDNDMLRDRLSWTLYGEMADAREPYGARRNAYVELFVDDRYEGVYLMLEPFDHETELAKTAGSTGNCIYRTCPFYESEEKPIIQGAFVQNYGYELHYPRVSSEPSAAIKPFIETGAERDDEAFARRMLAQVDLDSMIRYHLMMQGFGLGDNVFNNMYVWAVGGENGYTYRFIPWDMDMSWGEDDHIEWIREDFDGWLYFPEMDRLLNLNPDGLRARWAQAWRELREGVLSSAHVESTLMSLSDELNSSGAMLRNAARWSKDHAQSDPFEILNYLDMRFAILDETAAYIEQSEGDIPMLMYDDPQAESGMIYGFGGREKEPAQ